jgi:surface antigen/endonuclease/exonuclease/phosphatase family metal-dependent hydrolase
MEGPYGVYDADSRTVDISEWLNTDGNTTIDPDTGQEVNAKVNPCKLILSALQAAGGIYDPSLLPEDSLQSDAGATGLGGEFRIASFNIFFAIHPVYVHYSSCAHSVDYKTRLAKSVSVIKDNSFGVVGLQEVRGPNTPKGDQFSDLKALDGFSIFPTTYNSYAAQNPIIWNDDFTLVEGKVIPGYTVTGGKNPAANTQVKLRYKTGQEFYVINHHEPVESGPAGVHAAQVWRTESAKERAAYVKELAKKGLPIFLTGDMNTSYNATGGGQLALNGDRANLPYCILTDGTDLWDAIDAVENRTGTCPYTQRAGVDHVYMSTSVSAKNRQYFGAGVNNNGSDHNTLSVDVAFPGAEDAAGGGAATPGKGFVGNDGFGGGWCTDYVKWILNRHSSKYRGTASLGDGKDVARSLGGAPYGYTVNHTPAVHAVVSFPGPPYGDVGTRFAGHVAIVGQVNKDGSIVVEESNFTNSMSYGTHSVSAAEAKNLTYAHTEVGWH